MVVILIFMLIIGVLIAICVAFGKDNKKLKEENKQLVNEYQVVYNALKEAEKLKAQVHTGNNNNDFNNSVNILSDFAKRNTKS